MFGINGKDEIEGLQTILKRIGSNDGSGKLTHKEIRAYARCMITLISALPINFKLEPEIRILMLSLSSAGLPHYDRSFIANKILKLLEESTNKDNFDPDNF